MEEMIAYCGLVCHECPALIATQNDDDEKRAEVAKQWSKLYNADIKPGEVSCNGCLSKDRILFKHCQICQIRKCGIEKKITTCAHCDDYICEKLDTFFNLVPECKDLLKEIKEKSSL